jgi:poly(A) polymerase
MREVLQLQSRFENRKGARAARFLDHKRFRAAYDFMLLRANCGEVDEDVAQWWTEVQGSADGDRRQAFGVARRRPSGRRGGRRRRKRSRSDSGQT